MKKGALQKYLKMERVSLIIWGVLNISVLIREAEADVTTDEKVI